MKRKLKALMLVLVVAGLFLITRTAPSGQCFLVQGPGQAFHATIYFDLGNVGVGRHYGGGLFVANDVEFIGSNQNSCMKEIK